MSTNFQLLSHNHAGSVFNRLVRAALSTSIQALRKMLGVTSPTTNPSKSPRWGTLTPLVKAHLEALVHFLGQLGAPDMIADALRQLPPAAPLFASVPKAGRVFLKALLSLWPSENERVRLYAFICIRALAVAGPTFLVPALRGMYMTFVRNCKFPTPSVLPKINFLLNSVAALYMLDPEGIPSIC